MNEDYRAALRGLMERKGLPVRIDQEDKIRYPNDPDMWVSVHGWVDRDAEEHGRTCGWKVDPGVHLTEVSYAEFTDTERPADVSVGINVEPTESAGIRCTCGQIEGVTLRWEGSIMEAIQTIFGTSGPGSIIL